MTCLCMGGHRVNLKGIPVPALIVVLKKSFRLPNNFPLEIVQELYTKHLARSTDYTILISDPSRSSTLPFQIREKTCQNPQKREESTHLIHGHNARGISQSSQNCCTDPAHAECKTKEKTGNHPHSPRNQFLRIHQDRRKR